MSTDQPGREAGPALPRVIGAAPLTPEQRDADEWAEAAAREALPRIRELAGRWGATVTALTGLFGVGSLVSGDSVVRELPLPWRITYGGLSLVALAAAALAILAAAQASQATVALVGPGVGDRVAERARRIDKALRRLARSRLAAGVALVFAAGALAVRWYA